MLKKLGGLAVAGLAIAVSIGIKALFVGGAAVATHTAVNAYEEHEATNKAYDSIEQGASNCWGKAGVKIDEVTTINSCFFDRNTKEIIYNFAVDYKSSDLAITPEIVAELKKDTIANRKATDKDHHLEALKEAGIDSTYTYYSIDGVKVASFTIKSYEY